MDRRTWWRRTGALAIGCVLAGCAGLGLSEPVQVNVVGIEPLPGEGMEVRMAVKLRVQNPNDAALEFDGISMTLDVHGSTFATGVSDARGSVPRFGETVITVPVSVSALAAVRQVIALATGERSQGGLRAARAAVRPCARHHPVRVRKVKSPCRRYWGSGEC